MIKNTSFARMIALHIYTFVLAFGISNIGGNLVFAKNNVDGSERVECSLISSTEKCKQHDDKSKNGQHCKKMKCASFKFLNKRFHHTFIKDTSALIEIETYRDDAPDSEERITANLKLIQKYLNKRVRKFNKKLKITHIIPFEWKKTIDGQEHWVFGFRVGEGPRKFSMLTHLDTVPEGGVDWSAFEPRIEMKSFDGVDGSTEQPFLIGRGAIDDKGPGIVALTVLETSAKHFDFCDGLSDWTLELLFDTSEETGAQTPYYMEDVGAPELGIVFDAFWSIRAEKGMERPTFSIPVGKPVTSGLWISDFSTPSGSVNQIPSVTTARIKSSDSAALANFAAMVISLYKNHVFDDPDYNQAPLDVEIMDDAVILTTHVLGAQHGSAPEENRADGANPAVSLGNFLADLIDDGTLEGSNGYGQMVKFMQWGWGTYVFGEKHPDILQRSDDIFQDGNGTTYAITRVQTNDDLITLAVDVRYAQGHHQTRWDSITQGFLPGKSLFAELLPDLVYQFNQQNPEVSLSFNTRFLEAPDIRDPQSESFQAIKTAYQEVIGTDSLFFAVGGGTDAKGYPSLVAAGALFTMDFGEPINYHGIYEGAPIKDLRLSAQVLYKVLLNRVEDIDE